ncbi:MAG: Sporulation kinase E [Pelotomaculum sp. PtaB.Bin013]|nr:MAG: Sporulation kinase E [Pelotomaculum sp. PtaB.Bin013]
MRFVTKEKDLRWTEIFACLTFDAENNITGITGTLNDVTERILLLNELQQAKETAEEAFREKSGELRAAHQQLLDIIDFLPDATFVVNQEKKVIAWNKSMEKMTGVPKEEILGKGDQAYSIPFFGSKEKVLIDYIFLTDKEKLNNKQIQIIGTTYYLERFVPSLNKGEGAYLWAMASPLFDSEGNLVGAIQSIRDITHRKRYEDAIAAEKEKLAVTLRSIGDGVITTDTNHNIELVNKAAEDITGWTQEEASGRPLDKVFHLAEEKSGQVYSKPLEEILKNPNNTDITSHIILMAKDGARKIITLNVSRIKDKDDIGNVLVFRDITERKRLEAQLALSQKMESIGQLAAGIAHEINTPMQYVGDNTRFLQDAFQDFHDVLKSYRELIQAAEEEGVSKELSAKVRQKEKDIDIDYLIGEIPQAIAQSLDGIKRVSQIVLAMKEFSHPGKKEKTLSDINRAIASTVIISRNEWKYVSDLETILEPNLPLVKCVIDEINQVILNMIINAAHSIKEVVEKNSAPKGKITIITRNAGTHVQILISDTGAGIPPSIIQKIYEPFFTTKEVGKGTGQGLAIAHDIIINKHKGNLNVESELGKGTTFTISLPLTETDSNN